MRLLDDSVRAGVWQDSVQVSYGQLSMRLPTRSRVWLTFGPRAVGHLTRRGSRRVCSARSSNAHIGAYRNEYRRERGMSEVKEQVIIGVDPHSCRPRSRSSISTRSCWAQDGSPPTGPATQRCASTPRRGPSGSGWSRAATEPAGRWRSGFSRTANEVSMCRSLSLAAGRYRHGDLRRHPDPTPHATRTPNRRPASTRGRRA